MSDADGRSLVGVGGSGAIGAHIDAGIGVGIAGGAGMQDVDTGMGDGGGNSMPSMRPRVEPDGGVSGIGLLRPRPSENGSMGNEGVAATSLGVVAPGQYEVAAWRAAPCVANVGDSGAHMWFCADLAFGAPSMEQGDDCARKLEGVDNHSGCVDGAKCRLGVTISTSAAGRGDGDGVRGASGGCITGRTESKVSSRLRMGLGANDKVEERSLACACKPS